MTANYYRGQKASAWPLARQPCKVDFDLHTIARAHYEHFLSGRSAPDYAYSCTRESLVLNTACMMLSTEQLYMYMYLLPKFAQEHDERINFGHRARVQQPERA